MTTAQMAQRDVFLAEIRDDPDDDVPRLVLGDWLADHGDPRGEFIQIDVRLASIAEGAERRELEERRRQLLAAHATDWLGPLMDVAAAWSWERGMLHLTLRASRLHGDKGLFAIPDEAFAWIEGVCLRQVSDMTHSFWRCLLLRITALDLSDDQFENLAFRLLRY
jgi:uncharacterized protein (TIGR02996 family)